MNYRSKNNNNLKAINTPYKGRLFRSRTEAKWAYYFDLLNTEWEYEEEGFELGDGVKYLPDFYLPQYEIFAEVKGNKFSWEEHNKCKRLANLSRKLVIELVGLPSTRCFDTIEPYTYYVCPGCNKSINFVVGNDNKCGCNEKLRAMNGIIENHAVLLLQSDKQQYKPLYYTGGEVDDDYTNDPRILKALSMVGEVRFEFNDRK